MFLSFIINKGIINYLICQTEGIYLAHPCDKIFKRDYNCIPKAQHVSGVNSVASVLWLQYVLHVMLLLISVLYFYNIYFPKCVCAVLIMAVLRSFVKLCFPSKLLRYFLNDLEIFPVAPIITGIKFLFTFHISSVSIVTYLNYNIFRCCYYCYCCHQR